VWIALLAADHAVPEIDAWFVLLDLCLSNWLFSGLEISAKVRSASSKWQREDGL
jgi:hypothetical protein